MWSATTFKLVFTRSSLAAYFQHLQAAYRHAFSIYFQYIHVVLATLLKKVPL
jgi:hypothetical protein